MKPYLLMLLLAIPQLVSNILACEGSEPATAPAPAKSVSRSEASPAPRSESPPATPAPKPAPARGTTASHNALFM